MQKRTYNWVSAKMVDIFAQAPQWLIVFSSFC